MAIIAIQYEYDATKLDTIAENRPLHRAHLKELKDAGKLLASGPLGSNGALLVVVDRIEVLWTGHVVARAAQVTDVRL